MQMYKNLEEAKRPGSIKKRKNRYSFSNAGEQIGEVILTQDEAYKVFFEKDIQFIADAFKVPVDEIYVDGSLDSSLHYTTTADNRYHMSVHKKLEVNEMGYGVFELKYSMSDGNFFQDYKSDMTDANIIPTHNLKEQVLEFFNNTKETGRKNKLGILSFGSPGNGKTTDLMSLFANAEAEKMRIFIVNRKADLGDLNSYRSILEGDKTVFILEELTQRTVSEGTEELLTFMDGENSWTNSVTIATTNYPELLPANLVDRPGRFENFIEYKNPTKEQITTLASKFDIDDASSLFNQDLSFDYVSFILSQAKKLGKPVKEAREFEENKRKKLSGTFKGKIGIG
jgi:predicted AAA+ superfamily ATPase